MTSNYSFLDVMRESAPERLTMPPMTEPGGTSAADAWLAAVGGTAPPLALADTQKCAAAWLGQFDLSNNVANT